jgi:hypothetical protein
MQMSEAGMHEARSWAARVDEVPAAWFLRPDGACGIHGVGHTRRVCVHVLRLSAALDLPRRLRDLTLTAARWHDLGRTCDGIEPEHGARSVRRVRELGLADELVTTGGLTPADLELVLFAIRYHSLDDATARRAAADRDAFTVLWLLKDADALDRVRLGGGDGVDPAYLRHPRAADLIDFAWELYALI